MTDVSEDKKKEIAKKANVVAVGHAPKRVNGAKNGERALTAFVHTKKSDSDLRPEDRVPREVDGVKTDVQDVGTIEIEPVQPNKAEKQDSSKGNFDPTERMRPFPEGSSIGHQDITAGTFGRRMWRKASTEVAGEEVYYAEPVIYSNNHVIANENKADGTDNVLQPGPADGGKNVDEKYGINNWIKFVELKKNGNLVDGAWCDVKGHIANGWQVNGNTPVKKMKSISEGDTIYKPRGRTTGYRKGEVLSTDAVVNVKFGSGTKQFSDQILTTSVSEPGDSGSTVYKKNTGGEPDADIGTLFAGSSKVTVINKIDNILNETGLYLNREDVYEDVEGETLDE